MTTVPLTDARAKALRCAPGERLREVRDTDVRGLELRVTAGGIKSWRLHYTRRSDGKRRVIGLGSYPSLSLKTARTRAKRLQAQIEDQDTRADPAARRQERQVAHTFSQLAEDWKDRHGRLNKSARAFRDDESMLDRHILPEIGPMKASEITKKDIISLLDAVAAKPDARVKLKNLKSGPRKLTHRPNRVYELLRSIFRWAVGRDLLKFDPTFGVAAPIKKERPRERELSSAEILKLWTALDNAPLTRPAKRQERDFPMTYATALTLKLALATAQRIGEVIGIAVTELDLNDTTPMWTVPGERSKNGLPNRVPLSPLAHRLINEARQLAGNSPWLFPSPRGRSPIDPHAPTKALERARPVIGISDFRIHDLRRTAATRMAELGVPPHTISLVLNHVSAHKGTITSKVYVQYSYDREKREALNAWGARLERIITGTSAQNVMLLKMLPTVA